MIGKNGISLTCPVRGEITVIKKSKDGLKPLEEFYRVEAIKYLVRQGYPPENFIIEPVIKKFGNSGRNSFRADFAVLKVGGESINTSDPDELLKAAILLCEVKRENKKNNYVKNTQVKPMLEFAKINKCIGLYWDNIEQRVFWTESKKGIRTILEGPLSYLPKYGEELKATPLTFSNLETSEDLIGLFKRIEDILHQAAYDHERRYEIILQLLLGKIYDEHQFAHSPDDPLGYQDFKSLGTEGKIALKKINTVIDRSITYYSKHLPRPLKKSLEIPGDILLSILEIISSVKIIESKQDVVQTFYMKFAKDMYKWDLAQYFTPVTITDFIIKILNPSFGEHICDPACGSADFLTAAFRYVSATGKSYSDSVWGRDNSENAVQIAVLNMLLNGDGKTNISKIDSLETVNDYLNEYDIVICNPPFGTQITEKRKEILKEFEFGHEISPNSDGSDLGFTNKIVDAQETGILFSELCIKQCRPGGRIGLILPNGYLGNRSAKYKALRQFFLKKCKVVGIVAFPRFTFKKSGADVSASIIFLQKRTEDCQFIEEENYPFFIELIENLGWEAGNKKGQAIYKRRIEDGSFIIDDDGQLIVDSDFEEALEKVRQSNTALNYNWLNSRIANRQFGKGWSVNIADVTSDKDLTLDPKRYVEKVVNLRNDISKGNHFSLGEVVNFLPHSKTLDGRKLEINNSSVYKYVEISGMNNGEFSYSEYRGWQLPSRARHFASSGDIYFGSIWSSVSRWCFIGAEEPNLMVTNGCHRVRLKPGKKEYLFDILAFLNTEGWAVQMRSFARGSDGLAEITPEDAAKILIPRLPPAAKSELENHFQDLLSGQFSFNRAVMDIVKDKKYVPYDPKPRNHHIVLV